ncbi:MAG TPA: Rid family detoxifying hydrolase [Planctomycetota bacterium]|nr:Rid family detoxifying hydrolase [Planctomycetota bacterium]
MSKQVMTPTGVPNAIGPYSIAVRAGDTLYVSGNIPRNPVTGAMVTDSIENATRQVMNNLRGVLTGCGIGLMDVVKTTVYLKNMDDFAAMNKIYAEFFTEAPPARSTIQAAKLPADSLLEIDCIAVYSTK